MRVICALLLTLLALPGAEPVFERGNLVAWCIVPFDAKKRGPEERAAMLARLGLRRFVYDYRAEHVPQWDAELAALKKQGIKLEGWWFPTTLNDEAKAALAALDSARLGFSIANINYKGTVLNTVSTTENLYYNLVASREALRIAARQKAMNAIHGCPG